MVKQKVQLKLLCATINRNRTNIISRISLLKPLTPTQNIERNQQSQISNYKGSELNKKVWGRRYGLETTPIPTRKVGLEVEFAQLLENEIFKSNWISLASWLNDKLILAIRTWYSFERWLQQQSWKYRHTSEYRKKSTIRKTTHQLRHKMRLNHQQSSKVFNAVTP